MAKSRGGVGKQTKRSTKGRAALVETWGKTALRPSLSLARKRQPAIPVEKLRTLRHLHSIRVRPGLFTLLLVGEGRSQFSLTSSDE